MREASHEVQVSSSRCCTAYDALAHGGKIEYKVETGESLKSTMYLLNLGRRVS